MAIQDFLEIKREHPDLPIEQVVRLVGAKYNRNVDMELLAGKPLEQITKELMAQPQEGGFLTPVWRGIQKGLIQAYGTVVSVPEFFGIPMGAKTARTALRRMEEYAPKEGWLGKLAEETISMAIPSIGVPFGIAEFVPKGVFAAAVPAAEEVGAARAAQLAEEAARARIGKIAQWAGPVPFATQAFLTSKEEVEKELDKSGQQMGYMPLLTGLVNGLIEYFGVALGTKYLGRLFGLDEAKLLTRAQRWKALIPTTLKESAAVGGRIGAETLATEIAKDIASKKEVDIDSAARHALLSAVRMLPPTIAMTLISGGLSAMVAPRTAPETAKPATEEAASVTHPYFGEEPGTLSAIPMPSAWEAMGGMEVPLERMPTGAAMPPEEAIPGVIPGMGATPVQKIPMEPGGPETVGAIPTTPEEVWATMHEAALREEPPPQAGIAVEAPWEFGRVIETPPAEEIAPAGDMRAELRKRGFSERRLKKASEETLKEIYEKGYGPKDVLIKKDGSLKLARKVEEVPPAEEVPAPEASLDEMRDELRNRGFKEPQLKRAKEDTIKAIYEQGYQPKDVSITRSGDLKVIEKKAPAETWRAAMEAKREAAPEINVEEEVRQVPVEPKEEGSMFIPAKRRVILDLMDKYSKAKEEVGPEEAAKALAGQYGSIRVDEQGRLYAQSYGPEGEPIVSPLVVGEGTQLTLDFLAENKDRLRFQSDVSPADLLLESEIIYDPLGMVRRMREAAENIHSMASTAIKEKRIAGAAEEEPAMSFEEFLEFMGEKKRKGESKKDFLARMRKKHGKEYEESLKMVGGKKAPTPREELRELAAVREEAKNIKNAAKQIEEELQKVGKPKSLKDMAELLFTYRRALETLGHVKKKFSGAFRTLGAAIEELDRNTAMAMEEIETAATDVPTTLSIAYRLKYKTTPDLRLFFETPDGKAAISVFVDGDYAVIQFPGEARPKLLYRDSMAEILPDMVTYDALRELLGWMEEEPGNRRVAAFLKANESEVRKKALELYDPEIADVVLEELRHLSRRRIKNKEGKRVYLTKEGLEKIATDRFKELKSKIESIEDTPSSNEVARALGLAPELAELLDGSLFDYVHEAKSRKLGRTADFMDYKGGKEAAKRYGVETAGKGEEKEADLVLSAATPEDIINDLKKNSVWKTSSVPRPASVIDAFKNRVESTLQRYADRILGSIGAKIEILDPERFWASLQTKGVTEAQMVKALEAHGYTREQIARYGLPELIKRAFLGATVKAENLVPLIYINEHVNSIEQLRAGIHELTEALLMHGKLDERDLRIIKREFGERWKERFADSVADYILSEDTLSPRRETLLGKVYNYIKHIVARFKNLLYGDGFRSARDIMEGIRKGEYAEKPAIELSESDFANALAFSLAEDPAIQIDLSKQRLGLEDIWRMIRNGLAATGKQVAKLYENWIMNPQWNTDPFRKTVFDMVKDATEETHAFVYDTLHDLDPLLKTIRRKSRTEFNSLSDAVIVSDKTGTFLSEDVLRRRFKLSDDSIAAYKLIKEKFDEAITRVIRAYQYSIAMAHIIRLDPHLRAAAIHALEKGGIRGLKELRLMTVEELTKKYGMKAEEAAVLQGTLKEAEGPIKELDRQLKTYLDGFYFPRIRPGGKYGVLLYVPEGNGHYEFGRWHTHPSLLSGKEAAELEALVGKLKKHYENPVELKTLGKGKAEEVRKLIKGKDLVLFRNNEDFLEYKKLLSPDQHAAVVTEMVRMPASFFENVSSTAVLKMLDYALTKLKAEEITGEEATEFANKLSKVIHEELADMMKERSKARSRFIRRRGREGAGMNIDLDLDSALHEAKVVEGYKTDLLEVLPEYMTTMGQHTARVKASARLTNHTTLPDVKEMLATDPDQFKWYSNFTKGVMSSGGPLQALAQRAKSISILWFLGGRLSSAFIQLTQMFGTAAPELAPFIDAAKEDLYSYTGKAAPLKEVGRHLSRQKEAVSRTLKAFADVVSKSYSDEEHRALEEGIRRGSTLSQFTADMMANSHKLLGRFTHLANMTLKPFQMAEAKSREAGFLAAFRLAREKGLEFDEAVDFASRYVDNAYHIYLKINRPLMALRDDGLGAVTNVLTSLRGFELNYLGWLYQALKGEGGKRYADKVLASFIYTGMMGGLFSVPFVDQILKWIEKMTGKPLHHEILKAIPEGASREAMAYGILAPMFGVNLSGSLRLGLIPDELSLRGMADMLFGVWRGSYNKFRRARDAANASQWDLMLEALAPLGVERVAKGIRALEGKPVRTSTGKVLTDLWGRPVKPTQVEALLETLGFQPVTVSEAWEQRRAAKTVESYWKRKREAIARKIRYAKSYKDWVNIMKEINEYNRKVLKYRGGVPFIDRNYIVGVLRRAMGGRPEKLAPYLLS